MARHLGVRAASPSRCRRHRGSRHPLVAVSGGSERRAETTGRPIPYLVTHWRGLVTEGRPLANAQRRIRVERLQASTHNHARKLLCRSAAGTHFGSATVAILGQSVQIPLVPIILPREFSEIARIAMNNPPERVPVPWPAGRVGRTTAWTKLRAAPRREDFVRMHRLDCVRTQASARLMRPRDGSEASQAEKRLGHRFGSVRAME